MAAAPKAHRATAAERCYCGRRAAMRVPIGHDCSEDRRDQNCGRGPGGSLYRTPGALRVEKKNDFTFKTTTNSCLWSFSVKTNVSVESGSTELIKHGACAIPLHLIMSHYVPSHESCDDYSYKVTKSGKASSVDSAYSDALHSRSDEARRLSSSAPELSEGTASDRLSNVRALSSLRCLIQSRPFTRSFKNAIVEY